MEITFIADLMITAAGFILAGFLVPAIRSKREKPPVSTCAGMTLALCLILAGVILLKLPFSAVGSSFQIIGWGILWVQKVKEKGD